MWLRFYAGIKVKPCWRKAPLKYVHYWWFLSIIWQCVTLNELLYYHPLTTSHAAPLRWRHNERYGVTNHQPHDCLLNRLFRRRSKKTTKLRGTGLCEWNSPVTGEFPAQKASNAENVFIWWRHHNNVLTHLICQQNDERHFVICNSSPSERIFKP